MSCGDNCKCASNKEPAQEHVKESWQQTESSTEKQEQERPEGCCGGGCCDHEKRALDTSE